MSDKYSQRELSFVSTRCFIKFKPQSQALQEITTLLRNYRANAISSEKTSFHEYQKFTLNATNHLANGSAISLSALLQKQPILSSALASIAQYEVSFQSVMRHIPLQENVRQDNQYVGGIERLFVLETQHTQTLQTLLTKLQTDSDIEYIEPERIRYSDAIEMPLPAINDNAKNSALLTQAVNDQYFSRQWYLQNLGQSLSGIIPVGKAGADIAAQPAWGITTGSSDIVVAVIDTGVPVSGANASLSVDFTNTFVSAYNFGQPGTSPTDNDGHGTNIASIIAATGNNGRLVAGINWNSRIMPLKVTTQRGSIPNSLMVQAIIYAAEHGADVINLSLGGTGTSNAERNALQFAASKGCIVVAAMGNENSETPIYPAAYSTDRTMSVLAIGATDNNDQRCNPFVIGTKSSGGSNFGDHLSFVAPGNAILGVSKDGMNLTYYSGTSQAAPVVSGIISLLLSVRPTIQFQDVVNALKTGARDMVGLSNEDVTGWDKYYGWGRVDAYRALASLGRSTVTTAIRMVDTDSPQRTEIYPNPARSFVTIRFHQPSALTGRISIIDILGRIIWEEDTPNSASMLNIRTESFPTGMYSILFRRGTTLETLPLVIIH